MEKEESFILTVHPLNEKIYGEETLAPDFLESVKRFGLIQPIVVSRLSGCIVSGSRRFAACQHLGIKVPSSKAQVVYRDFDDELSEEEFLIEANRQRRKTPSQFWNEAKHLKRIYEMRAKGAKIESGKLFHKGSKKGSVPQNKTFESINTRETVAEKVGLPQGTFAKLEQLGNAADDGNQRAKELLVELDQNKRTIGSAYAVFSKHRRRETLKKRIFDDSAKVELPRGIQFGDAFELMHKLPIKSVDAVVTSPPFELAGDYCKWFDSLLEALERVTIDYAFIFNSSRRLIELCKKTNPFRILIWDKKVVQEPFRYEPILLYKFSTARYNINDHIWSDLLEWSPPDPHTRLHEFQNPTGLYDQLVRYLEAERILDPFLGSGTTYRVCKALNKTCIGFEKERAFEKIIALDKDVLEK